MERFQLTLESSIGVSTTQFFLSSSRMALPVQITHCEFCCSSIPERLHLDGNNFEGPIPEKMFQDKKRFGKKFLQLVLAS
jgi:hypothetical protein